jgi:hypothetical protein
METLECRRHLDGTLDTASLTPTLAPGLTWAYQNSGVITSTITQTVVGPTTFNGNSAIEEDATTQITQPFAQTSTSRTYLGTNASGFVQYGVTSDVGGTEMTLTYDAPYVELPATLTPNVPSTSTTDESNASGGGTGVHVSTLTIAYTLQSPIQHITVPAGSFDAYEIDVSITQTAGEPSTFQEWFAPNVGLVQSITGTGPSALTEQLTSFSGSTGGTGGTGGTTAAISAALTGPLPASVVGTATLKLKDSLKLTAQSAFNGKYTASVFLSSAPDGSDDVYTLSSTHGQVKLAAGKSKVVPLRFSPAIPASVPAGSYYVFASTTDASGNVQLSSITTLTIAAPSVDLTGAVLRVPSKAVSGKKTPVTFEITNTADANVPAIGTVSIYFVSSSTADGGAGATLYTISPAVISRKINLKPGKSTTVSLSVVLNTTSYLGISIDPLQATFTDDLNVANNYFHSSTPIAVS